MKFLDHTCDTPAENLALDEALLELAERAATAGDDAGTSEVLRLWEPEAPLVVVGRSSKIAVEVNEAECARLRIPVLRRSSGGAAIVAGPGCLMYALVLSYRRRPHLRALDQAHRTVMETLRQALIAPGPTVLSQPVEFQGTCDLTLEGRKFSGNSVRCRRENFLYHGTLLYNFPLELIGRCLNTPPRQPDYRAGRGHEAFVANLPLPVAALRRALVAAWQADEPFGPLPTAIIEEFIADKYSQPAWHRGII